MNWLKYTLFICLAAFAGCQPAGGSAPSKDTPVVSKSPDKPSASAPAADVTLQILDYAGIQRLVAGHYGQVVVVDCWSTGCPPCMRDFPQLVALSHKFGPEVACVSLSFDFEGIGKPEDRRPKVLAFLEKQGAAFDNVLASDDSDALYKKMKITSIPVVLVYDRRGKLRATLTEPENDTGPPLYKQVGAEVQSLLADSP
jgi:thiol-disulfide isomerase/thioredoxin